LTVLTNARLVQGDQVVDGGWIRCDGERFAEIGRGHPPIGHHLSVGGRLVVPGFVDIHVHGGGGGSFTTGSVEEGAAVAHFHRRHGTTTLLASLVTAPLADLLRQISVLADLVDDEIVAGLHLEGPFLSSVRCGAHAIPAIGHTDATDDVAHAAVDAGVRVATHLFNGMRPIHHREPGVVVALMERPEVVVELINDGVHLHPSLVRWVMATVGDDRAALVSDAIPAAGMADGLYALGGSTVLVRAVLYRGSWVDGQTP